MWHNILWLNAKVKKAHKPRRNIKMEETWCQGLFRLPICQKLFLGLSAAHLFLLAGTIFLPIPFKFELDAEQFSNAGESHLVRGVVLGVIFLTAPIFGNYIHQHGLIGIYFASNLVTMATTIVLGVLNWIPDYTWFITVLVICRVLQGIGCAGILTTTFVKIGGTFTQSFVPTIAALQAMIIIGLLTGQIVVNALGFTLAFWIIAGCLTITGIATTLILTRMKHRVTFHGQTEENVTISKILKIPSVAVATYSVAATAASFGFIGVTLKPYLLQFDLSLVESDVVFMSNGALFLVAVPVCCSIFKRIEQLEYLTITGNCLIFMSFICFGSSRALWGTIIGLVFQGLGMGCCFVFTFVGILRDSINNGLPETMSTYCLVTGVWHCMLFLGIWLGSSIAEIYSSNEAFVEGAWIFLVISFIAGMASVLSVASLSPSSTPIARQESQPLRTKAPSPKSGEESEDTCALGPSNKPLSYCFTSQMI